MTVMPSSTCWAAIMMPLSPVSNDTVCTAGASRSQCAVRVRSPDTGWAKSYSVSPFHQPRNVHPSRVGSAGCVALSPSPTVCASTGVPPALSNVTVCVTVSGTNTYSTVRVPSLLVRVKPRRPSVSGVLDHPSGMPARSTLVVPAGTVNVPPLTGSKSSTGSPFTVAVTVLRSSLDAGFAAYSNVYVTLTVLSGAASVHVSVPSSWTVTQSSGMPEMATVDPYGTVHVPDWVGVNPSTGVPSAVAVMPLSSPAVYVWGTSKM